MATEEQILEGDVHVLLLVFVAIHQCDSKAMLQLQHYQRRRRCKQCQVNDATMQAVSCQQRHSPESPVPAVCSSHIPTGKRLPLGKAAKFQRFNSSEVADVPNLMPGRVLKHADQGTGSGGREPKSATVVIQMTTASRNGKRKNKYSRAMFMFFF